MDGTGSGVTRNGAQPVAGAPLRQKRTRARLRRWLLWIGAVLVLLIAATAATVAILLHRAEPMLRASLIETLQQRLHAKVELDDLRASILDGFWVEGRGLRIWLPNELNPQAQGQAAPAEGRSRPWIVVDRLRFHASWRILPGSPIEVSVVHVEGVRVLLPPKEDRPRLRPADIGGSLSGVKSGDRDLANSDATPHEAAGSSLFKVPSITVPQIEVRKVECQGAELVIEHSQNPKPDPREEPAKPAKAPMVFEFSHVTLTPDGKGKPIAFVVDMTNPRPVGMIHSTGHMGPWAQGDPGELPVSGEYHFDHADLSTIKGIAGILSSTGHYEGTLRRIEADGETETPKFRLERAGKEAGLPLTTKFHAIVDGTNGNTQLQSVDAMLGHTHIVARGQVVRAADVIANGHGHDIRLQVTVDRGRIEDILHIAADSESPFITGNLTFQTGFHLPPDPPTGAVSIWDRLLLDGEFHLSQARFNNAKMQGRIEQLSLRGQGKPHDVKTTDPASVMADMHGHFKLAGGALQLPDLEYQVPGAKILAHGTYGLQGGTLSFDGDARMDATVSQMVGGWKGLLLKPVDRYLQKNGAGTDVPIRVSGTRKDPEFKVELDRLGKNDSSTQPQAPK